MTACLDIGPLRLELAQATRLPGLLDPFRNAGGSSATALCQLELGPVAPIAAHELVCDPGGIWCLCRDQDDRRLVLRRGGPGGRPYQELRWHDEPGRARARLDPACLPAGERHAAFALREPLLELWCSMLLARQRALLVHGALVEVAGHHFLFCGQSGAGKSTLCRVLEPESDCRVLCDDRVIVASTPNGWQAWSTPWHGEAYFSRPGGGPLAGLWYLEQAPENRLRPLGRAPALTRLLGCLFSLGWEAQAVERLLDLGADLLDSCPAGVLEFRPEPEVARLLAASGVREAVA